MTHINRREYFKILRNHPEEVKRTKHGFWVWK
ncbi:hypothetical protein SOV_15950 [Sporomusa ovata DSM 2662]